MSIRKNSLICFPDTRSFSLASSGNWHDDDSLFENVDQKADDHHCFRHSSQSSSDTEMEDCPRAVWSQQDDLMCPEVLTVDSSEFESRLSQCRYSEAAVKLNCKTDHNGLRKHEIAIPTRMEACQHLDSNPKDKTCSSYLSRERRNTFDMLPRLGTLAFRQRSSSGNYEERSNTRTQLSTTSSVENGGRSIVSPQPLRIQVGPKYCYSQYDLLNLTNDESRPLRLLVGNRDFLTNEMICKGLNGLKKGYMPWKVDDGSGGTYYLRDERGRFMGIFKPEDEEPISSECFASANQSLIHGIRKGVDAGEGAVREVIAYILDHGGFASVPATALVNLYSTQFVNDTMPLSPRHYEQVQVQSFQRSKSVDTGTASKSFGIWKTGSLQVYTSHDSSAEDVACGMFPRDAVHRIGVLDIRLLNTDRHCGNILLNFRDVDGVRKVEMFPIDHGLCLPDIFNIDNDIYFSWMDWPQAKDEFSHDVIKYIEDLDIQADISLIRSRFGNRISENSLLTLQIGTILLKLGVRHKLNLFQIGSIICGPKACYSAEETNEGHSFDSPLNMIIASVASSFTGSETGEHFIERITAELQLYMETINP